MSETNSHQELPSKDYIIPADYYDKYPLVFSQYHFDRIIVRIGMNDKQRQKYENQRRTYQLLQGIGESSKAIQSAASATRGTDRRSSNSSGGFGDLADSWNGSVLSREGDHIQQQIITSKIPTSQNLLN